jgi:hypothetical protein
MEVSEDDQPPNPYATPLDDERRVEPDGDAVDVAIQQLAARVRSARVRIGFAAVVSGLAVGVAMMLVVADLMRVVPAVFLAVVFSIPFFGISFVGLVVARWWIATRSPGWAAEIAAHHRVSAVDLRSYFVHM